MAQPASITEPPPPIQFGDMREVEVTDDYTEYELSFASPVTTIYSPNNVVPLKVFLPERTEGPIPVVLVLHYWGATDLRPERALATELARRQIGSVLLTLPYHLERTPSGRRSGDLAIEADPARLRLTSIQSVLDVRRALDFISSRPEFDKSKIGISGTSLGALVTSLAFAIDQRIAAATFVLGGVDFAQILWSSSRVVQQREQLRRRGFTEERLRESLKDVEPLTYLPQRQGGEAFVIGAKFDTVIPRQSTDQLIAALPNPRVMWLDTGHYGGIFVQRRLMREVASYFGARFRGTEYKPPASLYAPTFRLGIKADTGNGFDVALGLDLLRLDPQGETFASLLITPRGPSIFAGRKITPVLAAGAIISLRSLGIGVFWSTVL